MGLIQNLKSLFSGRTASGREADRVYIIDAEKIADNRDGRIGPMERFRAIQLLSRFAEREKVEIMAVLGGRPLREVAHGDIFSGVRVFYVEENRSLAEQMEKTLSETRGRKPVVVTNDKQLEARLQQRGIATLRVSTLRKAFEVGNGGEGGTEGQRGRDRRQRRGPPRQDRPREPQDEASETESSERVNGDDAGQPGDTVDGLIDRVK